MPKRWFSRRSEKVSFFLVGPRREKSRKEPKMEHGISLKSEFFRVPSPGRFRTSFWRLFECVWEVCWRFWGGFPKVFGTFSERFLGEFC